MIKSYPLLQVTESSAPEHNEALERNEALEQSEALERRVEQLEGALTASDAALNKLRVKLSRRESELERKSDKFRQLTSEIKVGAALLWTSLDNSPARSR